MPDKINVQCYKCQTIYELEPEMIGQLVECAVCNTVFLIPELTSGKAPEVLHTHPYVADNSKTASSAELEETSLQTARDINTAHDDTSTTKLSTDTIKITKNSRGMIPEVEDDKFGVCKGHHPPHLHKTDDRILDSFREVTAKIAPERPEPVEEKPAKKTSKWWHLISRKNKH
ncbi:MAG: hypothetical protein PHV59_01985 [Victivallales bacterium]|nr:hypothetical protein [Victivallales bacterium]